MEKLIIFGTGQISEIVSFYISHSNEYEIVAYTIDEKYITESQFMGKPVISFEKIQNQYPPNNYKMFVALGYSDLNKLREKKYFESKQKGYKLATYLHPNSGVPDGHIIGDNCFIMENQSIQAYSEIGNNCFIWGGVLIAHHTKVEDHCWITSESSIAGNTIIGKRCFIGINATIGHMITIGDDTFIGAGSIVTKSAESKSVFIEKNTELFKLNSDQFLKITKMR